MKKSPLQADATLPEPGQSIVKLVLEGEPEEFGPRRREFLADLARVLRVSPSDLSIIKIEPGCTRLTVVVPADVAEMASRLRTGEYDHLPEDIKKELLNLVRKWQLVYRADIPIALITNRVGNGVSGKPDRSITWLHLSDAHFEAPTTGTKVSFWGQDTQPQRRRLVGAYVLVDAF
jgi:hypothetical protein